MHDAKNQPPRTVRSPGRPGGAEQTCPLEQLGSLLGGAWTLPVLWVLGERGPQRFGNLKRSIEGISPKVLAERLKRMERDGLLWRRREGQVSPRVTYGLTEVGRELHVGLKKLSKIGDKLPKA